MSSQSLECVVHVITFDTSVVYKHHMDDRIGVVHLSCEVGIRHKCDLFTLEKEGGPATHKCHQVEIHALSVKLE